MLVSQLKSTVSLALTKPPHLLAVAILVMLQNNVQLSVWMLQLTARPELIAVVPELLLQNYANTAITRMIQLRLV